ncbi:MAG: YlbF family regulator [Clostridiales bacterium]|nr:YlbF family regulator [Clostridiales bacterium]
MNIYDTANKLAFEMKNSDEYKNYKQAKERVMQNPELKAKIEEFEKIRYDAQVLTIKTGEGDSEKMKKLQELYTILIENKDIKEYFDLEVKFNVMVADVNKIIAEAIKDVLQ